MSRVLPILFNAEMVLAILDGRKTVTRRLIKPQPKSRLCYTFAGCNHGTWSYPSGTAYEFWGEEYRLPDFITNKDKQMVWKSPCNVDDILYVRETWNTYCEGCISKNLENVLGSTCAHECGENGNGYYYKATDKNHVRWRPSIHMPKEAARLWLKIKDVRVERLQEITDEDCEKEGLENFCKKCHALFNDCDTCLNDEGIKGDFKELWDSTIKKSDLDRYGWDADPWVWVVEFERCEKPEMAVQDGKN